MNYDVVVIGGGPAGLAAALSASGEGANVLLIEREARLGGILKQCIHDGFGLLTFGSHLTGPEYAEKYIERVANSNIEIATLTYVTNIYKKEGEIFIKAVNRQGVHQYCTHALVLANGCRERTSRQVNIHGTRPSGVFTAGTAQYLVNILGQMPTKKCVILGSGDVGLIMARRLTLEGAEVLGVYEAKSTPSGLSRNIRQCLDDFDIPLFLSKTVTRLFGQDRLTAVEICDVDEQMVPIQNTQKIVECDALILSVGLIPENELARMLNIPLDKKTGGPYVDQTLMSESDGVFSCGNALCVSDLVDYVSQSGEIAGKNAAHYVARTRVQTAVSCDQNFALLVPSRIDLTIHGKAVFFFRVKNDLTNRQLICTKDGKVVKKVNYDFLQPNTIERVELDLDFSDGKGNLSFSLEEREDDGAKEVR